MEQEPGGDQRGVLRVALDPAATEPGDQPERAGEPGGGDALATVALAGVVARDPPVREVGDPLLVRHAVLDAGHLVGRAELGPADAVVALEDQGGVGRPGPYPLELAIAIDFADPAVPSGWKPMHQQPPKMPLLASTSAAKAGQVDSSRARTSKGLSAMTSSLAPVTDNGSRPCRGATVGSVPWVSATNEGEIEMGKIVVCTMVSIDGYTEGRGGDVLALPLDEAFARHNEDRVRSAARSSSGPRPTAAS